MLRSSSMRAAMLLGATLGLTACAPSPVDVDVQFDVQLGDLGDTALVSDSDYTGGVIPLLLLPLFWRH